MIDEEKIAKQSGKRMHPRGAFFFPVERRGRDVS